MEQIIKINDKNKINFIQYLRVIACLAIIVIHVSDDKLDETTGLYWWIQNIFDSISRWGVPVFFMITGITFLDKDISIKKMYKKYILRMVIIYLFWSTLYTLIFMDFNNISLMNIVESIIKGYYHLWFIYAIIGLYMIIPFLKKIVENKNITEYFLIIWFLIGSIFYTLGEIPQLENLYTVIQERLSLFFVLGYSGYCVLGYYIYKYNIFYEKRKFIYILGILGVVITIFVAQVNKGENTFIYENMLPSVILMSMAIFTLFRSNKVLNEKHDYLLTMANYTLGIYLIHPLILRVIKDIGINTTIISPLIMIPIMTVIVFIASIIITIILKKIKIINKII